MRLRGGSRERNPRAHQRDVGLAACQRLRKALPGHASEKRHQQGRRPEGQDLRVRRQGIHVGLPHSVLRADHARRLLQGSHGEARLVNSSYIGNWEGRRGGGGRSVLVGAETSCRAPAVGIDCLYDCPTRDLLGPVVFPGGSEHEQRHERFVCIVDTRFIRSLIRGSARPKLSNQTDSDRRLGGARRQSGTWSVA